MARIKPAKRVRNMIYGLEELTEEFRRPEFIELRADIAKAINILKKVMQNLAG